MLQEVNDLEKDKTFCEMDFKITLEETDMAIKKLKNNKAPGIDGIIAEIIKTGKSLWNKVLHKLFNNIFVSQRYPKSWTTCLLTPIHKKGDRCNMDNYRGISVNNVLAKLYSMVLLSRVESFIEKHRIINREQIGFRRKARTSDHMFVIRSLTQK